MPAYISMSGVVKAGTKNDKYKTGSPKDVSPVGKLDVYSLV